MRDAEKNRDPIKARKRAVADARCALRKLELLEDIERWARTRKAGRAETILADLAEALGVTS